MLHCHDVIPSCTTHLSYVPNSRFSISLRGTRLFEPLAAVENLMVLHHLSITSRIYECNQKPNVRWCHSCAIDAMCFCMIDRGSSSSSKVFAREQNNSSSRSIFELIKK